MNWAAFAIVAYLVVGLERGLRDALAIGPVQPSFILALAAFVALSAPPVHAVWAGLLLGLALDLTGAWPVQAGPAQPIIGPYALGGVMLAQVVLTLRGKLVRHHLATLAVLTFLGVLACQLIVVALLAIQKLAGAPLAFQPMPQLLLRTGMAAYTALLAVPMGLLLGPMAPLLGFAGLGQRPWQRRH
ncbi:MAG: hypothetical protein KatS3mg103_0221 [Phycisphaerales bacterium]|nr:MAG: hypothetical protein KatS3mg103_0221 [Phycisphaerales bacterium]